MEDGTQRDESGSRSVMGDLLAEYDSTSAPVFPEVLTDHDSDTREPPNLLVRIPRFQISFRTAGSWLNILGWLALLAFVIMTIGPGLIGTKVFLGTDLLTEFAPWSSLSSADSITNRGVDDTIDSVAPTSILISDAASTGNFALWDPYNAGGTEALATTNTGMLSPLSWPWWVLSHELAPAWVKLSEIAAVALGMALLLRGRWRLPSFTVPLATLIFVSSGFMISWTNWPQTRVAAFIPLIFWATDRLAVEKRWINAVPMGVLVACMIFGGFPAVTVYTIYAAVGFFFCRSIAQHRQARPVFMALLRSGIGVMLGLALSAVQLLPFVWQSTHNVNFEARSYGEAFPTSLLSTTVVPTMLGLPDLSGYIWPLHFIEGFSYVGVTSVILIVAAMLVRPKREHLPGVLPFFAVALVFVGTAVYSAGLANDILTLLPAISTSPIGRIRSVLGFFVAVLAALGATALYEPVGLRAQLAQIRNRPLTRVPYALIYVALAGVVLLVTCREVVTIYMSGDFYAAGNLSIVRRDIAIGIGIAMLVGTATLLVWFTVRRWLSVIVSAAAIVTTLVPAILIAHTWWPLSDLDSFYPETPAYEFLEQNLGQDRFVTVGRTMSPATSSAYQLRALSGHTFASPEWRELTETAVPGFYATQTYSSLPGDSWQEAIENPILDRLGVKYIVVSPSETIPGDVDDFASATGETELSENSGTLKTAVFSGPLRGVQLSVLQQIGLPDDSATLELNVVSESGQVLATTSQTIGGIGADQSLAVQGEGIPESTTWHVELTFSDSNARVILATGSDGTVSVAPVRPVDDGLELVHTGDATIFERTTALERVRWASSEEVVADSQENLEALYGSGDLDDTVILEHEEDAKAVDGTSTAVVTSEDVDTDNIEIHVESTGAGWVAIADAMRDRGWSATLDGESVNLVDADHATVAVYVDSAGEHTISLSYSPPYFSIGLAVTCTAGVLSIVAVTVVRIQRVRRRRDSSLHSGE